MLLLDYLFKNNIMIFISAVRICSDFIKKNPGEVNFQ